MPTHDLTAPSTTARPIDGLPGTLAPSTIAYPALARHMSSHQRTQGYVPSTLTPAFAPDGAGAGFAGVGTGARTALDAARAAAVSAGTETAAYSTSFELPPPPASAHRDPQLAATCATAARTDAERNAPCARLRTVVLPHATLPRFLAIASANSARNLETCGLLLGREVVKGGDTSSSKSRYVVETLLVPKQHATSDTIHTHPSQSCFMSSVDLHTHASFQRMLPESFAVVCAPKSDPNFGIFRLTDPPGLQTVLKCTAKQAFHPHPDIPIYTDTDRGHVRMRDAALEIVDLR
ncbi:hypothetical protein B0H17DRAFT_1337951 [Mycena rosella]|uniref:MPN domain-containing protein n=1 Tax=Mycena rosella TaxID=1033263 RepID=A0AAD7CPJ7_MYCRO|nr:hypothetical protein B0H17DRAFT_1337951 [Mycena rosella]